MWDMQAFGELVRTHRKKSGLSQIELANLAGVGKTTIFDIEKARHSFHMRTIVNVCKALNLKMEMLSPLQND